MTWFVFSTYNHICQYLLLIPFQAPEGKVVYTSKDGRTSKSFPALEWQANLCSHIPNRDEQMARYKDYVTLSETSVQLVIITQFKIENP
jgi:hypothetical protein